MAGLFRRCGQVGVVGLLWLGLIAAVPACPFCTPGTTLTGEVAQASLVLYGTLANADMTPKPELGAPDGTTDLKLEMVVKNDDWLKGKKVVTLPRYIQPEPNLKFLVFCDVFKDKLDPYRGVAVKADSDMPKYLKGALAIKDEKIDKRLHFFFDYLDNADSEISNDAYREFANADYKDYKGMAGALPADKIAGWLKDPKTPSFRFGLYASMLGHAGQKDPNKGYAELLRGMLDNPEVRIGSGVDGILAGYVMLKPKEGMELLKSILNDPTKEFLYRYSALKSARFFWDYRPDIVGHKDLSETLTPLLKMGDIADLVIEDFRKWEAWGMTDRILELQNYPLYSKALIKRSIIRYGLSAAKHNEAAQKYIDLMRQKEPKVVNDVEELLKSGS